MAQKRKHWGQSSFVTHLCHPYVEISFLSLLPGTAEGGWKWPKTCHKKITLDYSWAQFSDGKTKSTHNGSFSLSYRTIRKTWMNSHFQIVDEQPLSSKNGPFAPTLYATFLDYSCDIHQSIHSQDNFEFPWYQHRYHQRIQLLERGVFNGCLLCQQNQGSLW